MVINYPNGRRYQADSASSAQIKSTTKAKSGKQVIFGGRGMSLEETINETNQYYRAHQQAVVYKKPTPVQIVKVDYPKRSRAVIKEAYFRQASTTDYNGVYQGYYLDFEAKETTNKRSFPLKNFHEHQMTHFENCLAQSGICFTIMRFSTLDKYYLLPATFLLNYWHNRQQKRQSIPLDAIQKDGFELKPGFHPALDYLQAVDRLIKQTNA